jgi:hypothetical protein
MKLLLSGRAGSCACEWSAYALLRDNVQHYIEHGQPGAFAALHEIESAVDGERCAVGAASLRGEVLRAWYELWKVSAKDAAVSLRTRAILTGSVSKPAVRGTVHARRTDWGLPIEPHGDVPVPMLAKRFVAAVLSLTNNAVDGEVLVISRDGAPPRFVARQGSGDSAKSSAVRLPPPRPRAKGLPR